MVLNLDEPEFFKFFAVPGNVDGFELFFFIMGVFVAGFVFFIVKVANLLVVHILLFWGAHWVLVVAAIGQGGNLLKILVLNAHIVHQNIKKLEQNLIFVPFEKLFQHRNVAAPFRKLAFRSQTASPDPIV